MRATPPAPSDTVMKKDSVTCCCATHSLHALMSLLHGGLGGTHVSALAPAAVAICYIRTCSHSSHSTVRSGPSTHALSAQSLRARQ